MNALVTLQSSLDAIANRPGPPDDAAAAQTLQNASQAKVVTRQMAQTFRIDSEGHLDAGVQKLLEQPITYVEGMLRALGPAELNAKGSAPRSAPPWRNIRSIRTLLRTQRSPKSTDYSGNPMALCGRFTIRTYKSFW
jgi:hypothetical protein